MLNTLMTLRRCCYRAAKAGCRTGLVEAPPRASNMPDHAHEPSTLTLALIGIGTIAIYLVATGRWRTAECDRAD